jgi:hypothetical protein
MRLHAIAVTALQLHLNCSDIDADRSMPTSGFEVMPFPGLRSRGHRDKKSNTETTGIIIQEMHQPSWCTSVWSGAGSPMGTGAIRVDI